MNSVWKRLFLLESFSPHIGVLALVAGLAACGGGGGGGGGEGSSVAPTPVDSQPEAVADSVGLLQDADVLIDILANDSFGGDGPAAATIEISLPAERGMAVVDDAGTPTDPTDDQIRYTPDNGYVGSDSFRYRIADADGDTAEAEVVVTVAQQVHIESATVTVTEKIKTLQFAWQADTLPHHWRLEVNADGYSGYTTVLDNIPAERTDLQLELGLHLLDWSAARYRLVAASEDGIEQGSSEALPVAGLALDKLVGYFKASNTQDHDYFGWSLALSADGETLAVGVPNEASGDPQNQDDNSIESAGAVYLFVKGDEGWSQRLYFKAPDATAHMSFGDTVSLSGDGSVLAVGAPARDTGSTYGAVYLFARSGDVWEAADTAVDALFEPTAKSSGVGYYGLALSADGSSLAVGAPFYSDEEFSDCGAVFVYSRVDDTWSPAETYFGEEEVSWVGYSLAFNGDGHWLAMGAPGSGVVFVQKIGSPERQVVGATGPEDSEGFGNRVALSAATDTLAVSAPYADSRTGAVYLFSNSGGSWQQQARLVASYTDTSDFGQGLALSADGHVLAASTPWGKTAYDYSGGVFIFAQTAAGWAESREITAVNANSSDRFGYAVAVSADGATLAAASPAEDGASTGVGGDRESNGAPDAGAVYLY